MKQNEKYIELTQNKGESKEDDDIEIEEVKTSKVFTKKEARERITEKNREIKKK